MSVSLRAPTRRAEMAQLAESLGVASFRPQSEIDLCAEIGKVPF
jgi:hypothetical protein